MVLFHTVLHMSGVTFIYDTRVKKRMMSWRRARIFRYLYRFGAALSVMYCTKHVFVQFWPDIDAQLTPNICNQMVKKGVLNVISLLCVHLRPLDIVYEPSTSLPRILMGGNSFYAAKNNLTSQHLARIGDNHPARNTIRRKCSWSIVSPETCKFL